MSKKLRWTAEALARVEKVPFLVRPLVRRRAEQAARERGLDEVTPALLDELKRREHRG